MTPLLGTKTPSAPVGDKSGGDGRAARSLLSCALWRGMGRLWRGMGGMGRPEPLSAQRPHQQQRLSVFYETRDPRPETRHLTRRAARGALWAGANSEVFTKHETRDTNHGFFPNHGFFYMLRPSGGEKCRLSASVGRSAGFKGDVRSGA